ncbi:HAD family hydrolase [Austwickia chelonae]|uniref:HAD family hydrolase n=1 Tax=Austwickia chelonae TaxID=100225 RepID=UPI000E26F8B9|nr:HAD-IA family hydrolase [Austwickia chelonae]
MTEEDTRSSSSVRLTTVSGAGRTDERGEELIFDEKSRPGIVLLDADGVLQRPPEDWLEQLLAIGGGPDFVEDCFHVEKSSLRGESDFRNDVKNYLATRGLHAVDVEDVLAPWLQIEVDPGALAIVAQLRRGGTRCYLATNQQAIRAAHMKEHLRYESVLDGCFYSYELKVAKPDPAYFERILARLGAAAADVLFVDDRVDNVESARSVGLHAEVVEGFDDGDFLRKIFTDYGLLPPQHE